MADPTLTGQEVKTRVAREVDSLRHELIELSLKIHANPELGFEEVKASAWLTTYLKKHEFSVEKGVGGLPTAFKAIYGNGKPLIALVAEYDALPDIGHACGHNVTAASSAGAGVASKLIVDNFGGTVAVFGTPAEELYGGKITMLEAGVFNGVDAAMMVHAATRNKAVTEALACINLDIEFFGVAAHAAAHPEQGTNALDAMILGFSAVNSLRQHIKDKARVHGIITNGGSAANVVPAYTAATLLVRSPDNDYLDELKQKVLNCFVGASLATGAKLEHKWGNTIYAPMNNNLFLAKLFSKNLGSLGRVVEPFEKSLSGFGSTDMGNISQVIPAIHPSIAIAQRGTSIHTTDFALAAASQEGQQGIVDAAKALAMTVADIIVEPDNLAKIREEFSCR